LPDANANNIPDVFENLTTAEPAPEPAPAPPAAAQPEGDIVTGLSGSGCTVDAVKSKHDPLMMILMILASAWLFITRGVRQPARTPVDKANNKRGILGSLFAALFLSGCSILDNTASTGTQLDTASLSGNHDARLQRSIYASTDINKHLSLELHSADLGSAGLSPNGRINYHTHGGSALFYAGKNRHRFKRRGLTGFARLGLGRLENSAVGDVAFTKRNATHALMGAGVEYMTKVGLGLRGEVMSFDEDAQYAQLGLVYRFGKQRKKPVQQIVKAPAPTTVEPIVAAAQALAPVPVPNVCDNLEGDMQGVRFSTDSAELNDAARDTLDRVVSTMRQCDLSVQLTAHTDSRGTNQIHAATGN